MALSLTALSAADLRLIEAVKKQDSKTVRELISQRADVNATEPDGFTALHWAAQRNNLDLTEALLAAGAKADAVSLYKITPMALACTNGNAALIERLLKAGVDPNAASEQGQTALMTAAMTGTPEAVRMLLTHGANPNLTEPLQNQTALMWAAAEGRTEAAALIIEFGGNVKTKSKGNFTPFLFAVRNGHIDAAKLLLDHGANINDVSPDGTSALNMAVVNAYFELAAVLVNRGADPNLPDPRGSALHTLAWLRKPGADGAAGVGNTPHGPPVPQGNVTSFELAKLLLEHGANPNARVTWMERTFDNEGGTTRNPPNIQLGRHYLTYVGATPFYVAAKNGDAPYMRLLADHGADPKLGNAQGVTPLMVAAGLDYWEGEAPGPFTGCTEAERLEAVKLAIELGNDINAQAHFGDFEMVGTPEYTLLYYPLNMDDIRSKSLGDPRWDGSSPLIGAIVSGQASIVQYLIDKGALVDTKTKLGWTPLAVAEGVFFANAKKEYPAAAAIIRTALNRR